MDMHQMVELVLTNQIKAEPNRETAREKRKADQEDLKRMMEEMDANRAETRYIRI
jgi:hypothetical protein